MHSRRKIHRTKSGRVYRKSENNTSQIDDGKRYDTGNGKRARYIKGVRVTGFSPDV
jgi:hypothetical protein